MLVDSGFVGQEHQGQTVSAIVGFDLTDEDSAEEEGKGHYYHADNQAGGREEVGAVV